MITVHFAASLRDLTEGESVIEVEAPSVRRLIRLLDERYPGIGERLSDATSVAINGDIIADAMYEDIPDGAEVHFVPTISGG